MKTRLLSHSSAYRRLFIAKSGQETANVAKPLGVEKRCLLLSLLLIGCGGAGQSSPFEGNFRGTFGSQPVVFSINAAGVFCGDLAGSVNTYSSQVVIEHDAAIWTGTATRSMSGSRWFWNLKGSNGLSTELVLIRNP